jgi:hypothetical protein
MNAGFKTRGVALFVTETDISTAISSTDFPSRFNQRLRK